MSVQERTAERSASLRLTTMRDDAHMTDSGDFPRIPQHDVVISGVSGAGVDEVLPGMGGKMGRMERSDVNDRITLHHESINGILIGDGQLNYRREKILEAYYAYAVDKVLTLTFDYQLIDHPAYNADRGPVSIFSGRLHAEF